MSTLILEMTKWQKQQIEPLRRELDVDVVNGEAVFGALAAQVFSNHIKIVALTPKAAKALQDALGEAG